MEEPKIRFSLTMPVDIAGHLAQLMEWLETTNATSVICQAITALYCREAAKREVPAEGCPNETN